MIYVIYKPLGPLVAPSLHSGRYSPGALGFLNRVDPSVSVSNYYIVNEVLHSKQITLHHYVNIAINSLFGVQISEILQITKTSNKSPVRTNHCIKIISE